MKKTTTLFAALILLFAAAFLLTSNRAQAQQADQNGYQVTPEYMRIEAAYVQVVKYYNKALADAEAVQIARCILYYANYYKIDPRLVVAVIVTESRFKPFAVSSKGAQGLGQLMPGTASYLGVRNAFDCQQNIYGTIRYLREQYDKFKSSPLVLDYMLAAYNAGPKAVEKYNGVPPYGETRNYVQKVKKLYRYFTNGS